MIVTFPIAFDTTVFQHETKITNQKRKPMIPCYLDRNAERKYPSGVDSDLNSFRTSPDRSNLGAAQSLLLTPRPAFCPWQLSGRRSSHPFAHTLLEGHCNSE